MDASRLGGASLVGRDFLQAAAEGYLGDDDYDALGEGWLEDALAYTQQPSKGVRGLLSRVRARTVGGGAGGGCPITWTTSAAASGGLPLPRPRLACGARAPA